MADYSDDDNSVSSQKPTPREPSAGPPGRLSGNVSRYEFGGILGGRHGKKAVFSKVTWGVFCA
jgi:hypothetical protein